MNFPNIRALGMNTIQYYRSHKAAILTGSGIFLSAAAFGTVIPATVKATREYDGIKSTKGKVTKKELLKILAKHYTLPIAMEGASIGFATVGIVTAVRETEAAVTAAAILSDKLNKRKEAEKEILPDKKVEEIDAAVAQKEADKAGKKYTLGDTYIYETGKGNIVFLDPNIGKMFRSSYDAVKIMFADLETERAHGSEIDLTDIAYRYGLDCELPKACHSLGFTQYTNSIDMQLNSRPCPEIGEPIFVIDYEPNLLSPNAFPVPEYW